MQTNRYQAYHSGKDKKKESCSSSAFKLNEIKNMVLGTACEICEDWFHNIRIGRGDKTKSKLSSLITELCM